MVTLTWIDCEERLPDVDDDDISSRDVLVVNANANCPEGTIQRAHYYSHDNSWGNGMETLTADEVTHWAEMPKAPRRE